MHEYYFANYRLLVDDAISNSDYMDYLAGFSQAMPATHTFTLHLGDEAQLGPLFAEAILHPIVCTTDRFSIHDTLDSWTFLSNMDDEVARRIGKFVLTCARDYSEMTLYVSQRIPMSSAVRAACEAGMTMRDGMPLHAALVE